MHQQKFIFGLLITALLVINKGILFAQAVTKEQLVGQWRNLTMRLGVLDAKTGKTTSYSYTPDNWQQDLHIKPIHTYFNADNSFYSEYYTIKDSLFYKPSGKWSLEGNKLAFFYQHPKRDTMYFTVSIKDNVATFVGKVDWSGDGKKDDDYYGTQQKQP